VRPLKKLHWVDWISDMQQREKDKFLHEYSKYFCDLLSNLDKDLEKFKKNVLTKNPQSITVESVQKTTKPRSAVRIKIKSPLSPMNTTEE
jgi:hypothetical protein